MMRAVILAKVPDGHFYTVPLDADDPTDLLFMVQGALRGLLAHGNKLVNFTVTRLEESNESQALLDL